MPAPAVHLRAPTGASTDDSPVLSAVADLDLTSGPELGSCIEAAIRLGDLMPPASPFLERWEALATLGSLDLTLARVVEPHLDAWGILAEAGRKPDQADGLYGVYAAEAPGGPAANLRATHDDRGDGFRLSGTKPWCSLAEHAVGALVTAWTDDGHRLLLEVDLRGPGVLTGAAASTQAWAARGLAAVTSTPVTFDDAPATAVGDTDWYLTRPGFAWGGVGVAAVWFGAAVALGRQLRASTLQRDPDQVALLHLGACDVALARARNALVDAALVAEAGTADADSAGLAAARTRQTVADSVEEVLARAGHALGPAPLTHDEAHARRVADLTVYLRQHHAERDQARLGAAVRDAGLRPDGTWRWW